MSEEYRGPVMLAATSVLKPPPARVSRLGPGIKLPRTVEIKTLVVCSVFFLIFSCASWTLFGFSMQRVLISGTIGVLVGWILVTYSPLEGETLGKWFALILGRKISGTIQVSGETARVYVGICPVVKTANGYITISHGFSRVSPGSVDERGGVIPPSERSAIDLTPRSQP
jgi:hypothetical protein